MQLVAVDIMGPFPVTSNGNQYILVAGDYFTRWMEAYAIPNQEAETAARKLTEMFFRFSPPEQLHSDQGRQFEGRLIAQICKMLGISKTRTSPYHPQGDGLVERFNRTLVSMLSAVVQDRHHEWEEHLRATCMAYNTSVQSSTGFTPFYLMFGRKARMPLDIMFGSPQDSSPGVTSSSEYATQLRDRLQRAYLAVRGNFQRAFERQKIQYDKNVHGKPLAVGDLVWLHSPVVKAGRSKKLHQPWIGPFKVLKKLSEQVYRIQSTAGA